jgi:nitrogen fixation protein FixH
MDPSRSPAARRWNPWPAALISFFAVAILGCAGFVVFCSRHPADLVAADYYEQEMRYQGQIENLQRARLQAPLAGVTYDGAEHSILIRLPSDGAAADRMGSVQLYRPSSAGLDRNLKLATDANGLQRIDAAGLAPGLWRVRVTWSAGRQDFYLDQNIVIGPKAS